jgi:L-malate glycosyltransferase
MKILHTVEFYSPSVGGMQEVVKQLSERLVCRGHDITVATTRLRQRTQKIINGVKIAEFTIDGNMARGMNGETDAYRQVLLNSQFDVITNFAAQQWSTDLALPILDQIPSKKVFVPTGFSGLYQPAYQEYFTQMPNWMHQYDANVFLSDDYRDINFAREHGIKNRVLIPNGAGADEFLATAQVNIREKFHIPENHFLILHVGSHSGLKGHAEAISIFRKAKIRNATFLLVAHNVEGRCSRLCKMKNAWLGYSSGFHSLGKRLIVTGLARADTIAAYQQADLFLFPSNIECSPVVLFECMASRTPFLTTDVGNAAEIIRWSGAGRLLPTTKTPKGISHADTARSVGILEEIYADKQVRAAMGEAGFAAWKERYTWEGIAKQYEQLYQYLMAS